MKKHYCYTLSGITIIMAVIFSLLLSSAVSAASAVKTELSSADESSIISDKTG